MADKRITALLKDISIRIAAWNRNDKALYNGNRREFHSYYKGLKSNGYWESFTWEKGIGLVSYMSGFRDGINYMELIRMNP